MPQPPTPLDETIRLDAGAPHDSSSADRVPADAVHTDAADAVSADAADAAQADAVSVDAVPADAFAGLPMDATVRLAGGADLRAALRSRAAVVAASAGTTGPATAPGTERPEDGFSGTGSVDRAAVDDTARLERSADLDDTNRLAGAPGSGRSPREQASTATALPRPAEHPAPAAPPRGTAADLGGPADPGGPPARPAGQSAPGPRWRRRAVLVPAAAVGVLAGAYGLDLAAASGEVPRHTVVAGVDIGGLSPSAAGRALEQRLAPRIAAERTVVADDVRAPFAPASAGIRLDVSRTVDAADHQPLNPWTRLVTLAGDRQVPPVLAVDEATLSATLDALGEQIDRSPVEATIALEGTTPRVVEPADGRRLDHRAATAAITAAVGSGQDATRPIQLPITVAHPHVAVTTAQRVLDETVTPALAGPVELVTQDSARRATIPVSAIAASLSFTPKDDGSLAVDVDPAKLQTALGPQLASLGSPARDATFEVAGSGIRVVPSADGTGIDPAGLARDLLPVLRQTGGRTVTGRLGPLPAKLTTQQAEALGITEQVSSFTTHFQPSPSATNIRVVAEEVNGALVKPGETSSLNTFTGPRGTAQGYVPANVISGGHLSKAVGGGISQFATTMYNAAFFAGVQDVHHKSHSFYISRYPAGREATVYDGLIDLVWKNDSPTGIYVQTQWVPGSITVTFWGTKHYDIESVSGDRRNVTEPAVQDKPDDGTCIPQSGAQGFDITVTRVFHELGSGRVVKKENVNTHYIAEAVVHCLPAPAAAPAPAPAPAPAAAPGPTG